MLYLICIIQSYFNLTWPCHYFRMKAWADGSLTKGVQLSISCFHILAKRFWMLFLHKENLTAHIKQQQWQLLEFAKVNCCHKTSSKKDRSSCLISIKDCSFRLCLAVVFIKHNSNMISIFVYIDKEQRTVVYNSRYTTVLLSGCSDIQVLRKAVFINLDCRYIMNL